MLVFTNINCSSRYLKKKLFTIIAIKMEKKIADNKFKASSISNAIAWAADCLVKLDQLLPVRSSYNQCTDILLHWVSDTLRRHQHRMTSTPDDVSCFYIYIPYWIYSFYAYSLLEWQIIGISNGKILQLKLLFYIYIIQLLSNLVKYSGTAESDNHC